MDTGATAQEEWGEDRGKPEGNVKGTGQKNELKNELGGKKRVCKCKEEGKPRETIIVRTNRRKVAFFFFFSF